MMENTHIERIVKFDDALIYPINSLLGQLSSRKLTLSDEWLHQIIDDSASRLFLLYHNDSIVGMLTLGIYSAPTSRKAWVEDVVVDMKYRGRGFGRMLVQHAIDYARELSPITLMLTSNPARIEANALYRAEGFDRRCTNVYKMEL